MASREFEEFEWLENILGRVKKEKKKIPTKDVNLIDEYGEDNKKTNGGFSK